MECLEVNTSATCSRERSAESAHQTPDLGNRAWKCRTNNLLHKRRTNNLLHKRSTLRSNEHDEATRKCGSFCFRDVVVSNLEKTEPDCSISSNITHAALNSSTRQDTDDIKRVNKRWLSSQLLLLLLSLLLFSGESDIACCLMQKQYVQRTYITTNTVTTHTHAHTSPLTQSHHTHTHTHTHITTDSHHTYHH